MKIKSIVGILICLFFLVSFSWKEPIFYYPPHIPKPQYNFNKNTLNSNKITLGRRLFYDPILSANHSISCASCHSPYNAFAHSDHPLSHGINDIVGTRNAPALFNLAWQKNFMWDGTTIELENQVNFPIHNPREMGSNWDSVIQKLNSSPFYRKLFFTAFNESIISKKNIITALVQFELTLVSFKSKYDLVKSKKVAFSNQEKKGYMLFLKNCNVCHTEPLFTNNNLTSNGLPIDSALMDYGKGLITLKSQDSFLFKVPSLRNLSYSYPYMHDGRFKKLSEVLNHYTSDKKQNKNLAKSLYRSIQLTSNEKTDLIAFILTLNDQEFVFNPNLKIPKNLY